VKISIRQARTFLTIQETGSVTNAAKALSRTQTSVTKALQSLEADLGVTVFERSIHGVELTPYGRALLEGAQQALAIFRTSAELVPPINLARSRATARFFEMDVSEKWLDAFLAVIEHRNLTVAAQSLGVSTTAVSSSLRKFEDSVATKLIERTANGFLPTDLGTNLASNVKLAKNYLRHALDEISSMQGTHTGRVVVGTLPLVRTSILPKAIIALLDEHPDIDIKTTESPYPDLMAGLRCGDVDFLLGALREIDDDEGIIEEILFEEPLSIVVRASHPLVRRKKPRWSELLSYKWVLPRHGTPTRALFEKSVAEKSEETPQHVVETSSLVTLRGLLMNSDMLTVLSRQQIAYEEEFNMLTILPVELPGTRRPIGITRRRGTMTPAAQLLIQQVIAFVQSIK
jgi:LysR family transcriptional regulator, regulator for genes of the gallate degradation pathway